MDDIISIFEISDLGPAPEGSYDFFSVSYRPEFDESALGTGATAKDAFDSALNQIALDGLDTKLLHEAGIEAGFYSALASTRRAETVFAEIGDDELTGDVETDEPILYHVGIRFANPNPDDDGGETVEASPTH